MEKFHVLGSLGTGKLVEAVQPQDPSVHNDPRRLLAHRELYVLSLLLGAKSSLALESWIARLSQNFVALLDGGTVDGVSQ